MVKTIIANKYVHIVHYISERCWDRLDDFFFAIVESPETSAFGFCQSLWLPLMFGRSIELFLPPLLGEEEDQHAAIYMMDVSSKHLFVHQ